MTKAPDASLRKNRIPIMMSDGELNALDDWMFANRVRSRAEAVRQLVATGLVWSGIEFVSARQHIGKSLNNLNVSGQYEEAIRQAQAFNKAAD